MTVKELREKLAQFDDNMEVMIISDEGYFRTIKKANKGYSCRKGKVIVLDDEE